MEHKSAVYLLCVDREYRRRGIGTGYLQQLGLTDAFLGYTYSGLERLYGRAGYKICVYYMMAEKKLT